MKIKGLSAIVTGGASGLGGTTAAHLAAQGAKVAILDLNEEVGRAHAAAIDGLFINTNVADDESAAQALRVAESKHGVARILVNCAGVAPAIRTVGKNSVPHSLDAFRRTIDINLVGTFNMIAKFAARLAEADPIGEERGIIVNTASIAAFDGQIGQAAYAASKGAIVGMTLPIARDLAHYRIRIVTIAPGIFLTPLLSTLPQAAQDAISALSPHPSRLGKPEEFAQLVDAIVTNPMLNGEVIRIDGATRMPMR